MKLKFFFVFLLVFLNLFCLIQTKELRINHVSALMSYDSKGIILKVTGDDCVQWSTNDPSLLKISLLDEQNKNRNLRCSKQIRVSKNSKIFFF